MRHGLLALVALLAVSSWATAQDAGAQDAGPFGISSLNTAFAMQGVFEGEYRVYPDRVEVRIAKADIGISEHCPYKGRRLLTGVRVGLVTSADGGRVKGVSWAEEFYLEQVMSPGDEHSLSELRFSVPRDKSVDLAAHWLAVEMGSYALDLPAERLGKGFAYAYSCRDIFTRGQQGPEPPCHCPPKAR